MSEIRILVRPRKQGWSAFLFSKFGTFSVRGNESADEAVRLAVQFYRNNRDNWRADEKAKRAERLRRLKEIETEWGVDEEEAFAIYCREQDDF